MCCNSLSKFIKPPLIVATLAITALAGCSSSDSDESTGYVMFYNASPNAPSIYLTIDEDINNDDSADHVERTYYSVAFGQSSGLWNYLVTNIIPNFHGVMATAPAVKTCK